MEKTTVMELQSYYISLTGGDCDKRVDDSFIAVNCAGACVLKQPFVTDNPRGREDYYLQYLVKGEMELSCGGDTRVMRAGDVIFYFPHIHYNYIGDNNTRYYWAHFSGSEAASLLERCGIENSTIYSVGLHDRLTSGFERLFADFISRDRYFELSLAQTLIKLCVDIARFKSNPDAALQGTDDRIDRVIARIHRSFDRELTVSELAAAEFISVGRLRTLFRERCGISPQQYIAALRINTAKQLLESPGLTIAEVARSVGIPDALYFSRIFRQHTGLTPSEYRAMNLTE